MLTMNPLSIYYHEKQISKSIQLENIIRILKIGLLRCGASD